MKRQRRLKNKTDYNARIALLKADVPRIVVRKTNRYIIGQYVKSKEAQDSVIVGVNSKELLEYGVDKKIIGSLKSAQASYLTGYLLGKKIQDKDDKAEAILDTGLNRTKLRIFAFLKGVIDSGVDIPAKEKVLPAKLNGKIDIEKIKKTIEGKFK